MRGSRKSQTLISFFNLYIYIFFIFVLVYEVREDPNTTKSGPSSAHQRTTILNTGLVACDFQGIRTSIAKKPFSPLWIRAWINQDYEGKIKTMSIRTLFQIEMLRASRSTIFSLISAHDDNRVLSSSYQLLIYSQSS